MRIILIGYGWRSLFYYRIAKALPERFTLVAWVLRTEDRAKEVAGLYHVETTCDIHTALALPHDLAILSLSASSVEAVLRILIGHNETVLCETSFTSLPLETLVSLYEAYKDSQSKIFVAEQYYRTPYFQACHALKDLLGPITAVRAACLHDHHGTSIIRHFLEVGFSNCSIQASSHTSWITNTGGGTVSSSMGSVSRHDELPLPWNLKTGSMDTSTLTTSNTTVPSGATTSASMGNAVKLLMKPSGSSTRKTRVSARNWSESKMGTGISTHSLSGPYPLEAAMCLRIPTGHCLSTMMKSLWHCAWKLQASAKGTPLPMPCRTPILHSVSTRVAKKKR